MPVVQDGPPPGGFPSVRIARRIPSTGPGGFTLFAVSASVMAYGFYLVRNGEQYDLSIQSPELYETPQSLCSMDVKMAPTIVSPID